MADAEVLPQAATVVLLRDTADGPAVLLVERPAGRGSFAGHWVFPGGGLDPDDGDPADPHTFRRAAVRECLEETGLQLAVEDLVGLSRWDPPLGIPKRVRTWFFLAVAPPGDVVIDEHELVDYQWSTPALALDRHRSGALLLAPPTWVSLHSLTGDSSAETALRRVAARPVEHFTTRHAVDALGGLELWEGDVAHGQGVPIDAPGPRHRLRIGPGGWNYERSL